MEECFNKNHASARNVIERCFGLLKMRWAILHSPSIYPIKTQCRIILACCLLHNLIRKEMEVDPLEHELEDFEEDEDENEEMIGSIDSSHKWTAWRNELAMEMCNEWRGNRCH